MRMDRPGDTDRFVDLANGVRLCYRVQGPREATPLLLVAGWDQGLTSWPAPFLDALLERGFLVIRHDNRDAGCSSRIQTPPPSKLRQFRERPRRDAYNLQDMADNRVEDGSGSAKDRQRAKTGGHRRGIRHWSCADL
jgi:pimeloyl-ACP methyl ester carboxylesterase